MPVAADPVSITIAVLAAIAAAVTDVWRFKVYNLLTIPVLFGAFAYHGVTGGWSGIGMALGGVGFALAVLLVPYLMGWLGAGDVKFVMALGAWLGAGPLVPVVVLGCLANVVYGLILAYRTTGLRTTWSNLQFLFVRFGSLGRVFAGDDAIESIYGGADHAERRRRLIPFSAMMGVGLVIAVLLARFR